MNRKTVAIIGYGYVGKAMAEFFKDHYDVLVYDPHIGTASNTKEQINEKADMAVVCVPTAMNEDQSVDTSIVDETIDWLEVPIILIKSTIPPGTTKRLVTASGKKIAFSPEYLGEGKYVTQWWKDQGYPHPTDMKYHDFQIFGGERGTTSAIVNFFKVVLGAGCKFVQTDSTTAEIVKYMENSWGGTKVIFCNTFAKIAQAFGADYNEVRELFLLDGRVERMHTVVFEEKPGFGGKCFPKDINGIVKASTDAGYEPELLKSILKINEDLKNNMAIDLNTGYKGSERHGAAKEAFKPLRVVLFGEESNSLFCDARDELRTLGHDVITRPGSDFRISDIKKLVKDFDVIYPFSTHVEIEPAEVEDGLGAAPGIEEEEEEEEDDEDVPKEPTDDMDDDSDDMVDVPGQDDVTPAI